MEQVDALADGPGDGQQVRHPSAGAGVLEIEQHRVAGAGSLAQARLEVGREGGAQAAEQASGDGMARIAEDFPDFALFDDAAAFEDHHAVADLADDRHLVGDQHDGQAQPAVDVAQQREDRLGALRVQRRGGFVAEQYLRLVHQRAGDADALFLPAGELRRIGVAFFLQADQLQQPGDPLLDPCPGHPGHPQRQGDVLPHGLGRHQVEVLEDHADASAQGDQALAVVAADVFVVDQHLPLAGTLQAIEGADQRGLSGAAAADDAEHFAAADFQVDLPQGLDSTGVALAQAVETDVRRGGARVGRVGNGSRGSRLGGTVMAVTPSPAGTACHGPCPARRGPPVNAGRCRRSAPGGRRGPGSRRG